MTATRVILSCALFLLCASAKPALSAGFDFPTHLQFMLKNLRDNAQDNSAPTVTEDHITLSEDQTSLLDLLGNDIDADKDTLKIVSVSAKFGEVLLLPNGQVKYIPPANFAGQDEITYMLYDGRSNPVTGLAYITVNAVNDAPIAKNDAATLIANTATLVYVLDNDSDVDGDALTITQVSAKHGQVLVKSNAIEYQPYFDFDGSDVIDYVIKDSAGATASAKVLITVLKENKTAPEITAQQPLVMDEDTSFTLDIEHITYIDRDSLPEDITLEVTQGQNYTFDGLTITPITNFNGELIIPITLFDGKHLSSTFELKITVNEVNDHPQAGQIIWESVKDEKFTIYMRGMMHDPDFDFWPLGRNDPRLKEFKYIFSKNAVREDHGGWTDKGGRFVHVPGARDDVFEYTPPSGFVGRDNVFFFVYDEHGAPSGRGDITIDIKEHKDSPVIIRHHDIAAVQEDSAFSLSINDLYIRYKGSFSNNDALSLVVQDMPGYYTFDEASGLVTIDPFYEENVLNIFAKVTDGVSVSNTHRISVPIISVNEAPVAEDFEQTLSELEGVEIDFRSKLVRDPEANKSPNLLDQFTYQFMSPQGITNNKTNNGQLVRVPGKPHGVFKYIPNQRFATDIFAFWVTDNEGLQSNKGTVVVKPPIPAVPTTPTLVVNGRDVQLQWGNVDFATSYLVEAHSQWQNEQPIKKQHTTEDNVFTLINQPRGNSKYRVKACNELGCSNYSQFSEQITIRTKPDAPAAPGVYLDSQNIKVTWNKTIDSQYYELAVKVNDNDWSQPEPYRFEDSDYSGEQVEVQWGNIAAALRSYKVKACNELGCSEYSPVSIVTKNYIAPPRALLIGSRDVAVSWDTSIQSKFDIQVKYNTNDWTEPGRFISDSKSISWSDLPSGYRIYKVRGCNSDLSKCTDWSAESNKLEVPVWIHNVIVDGSTTTLEWGPVPGVEYYDISVKFNDNNWSEPGRFSVPHGDDLETNRVIHHNLDGGVRSYKIRSCTGATCSAWSAPTDEYQTVGLPADTPKLQVSVPARTFIDSTEQITWEFESPATLALNATLYVMQPNTTEKVKLASSSSGSAKPFTKAPGKYQYLFAESGTYRFFAQACGNVDVTHKACSDSWLTEQRVEVINQEFAPQNSGAELTWPSVPGATRVVIESAACADASNCDMTSLDWSELEALENGETSLALSNSEGKVYRIKVCFSDGSCTSWVKVESDISTLGYAAISAKELNDAEFSDISAPNISAVGTFGGQASVSGGAASYSLPIQIAPGRNGVQPSVSLNYSSRSGSGIAGVGFNLSAGSQISRCSATYAQDGFTQNPQYNDNDRLCLDGQRLIAVSGNYGEDNTIYRTEIESFVRVTQSGAINGTSTDFIAEYADGTTAYFGQDNDARVIHNGRAQTNAWLISYQHDATANNYIHYSYSNGGLGEKLLSKIAYTGNEQTKTGSQYVQFNYKARSQARSGYVAGGYYESTQLLSSIGVYSNNSLVRQYKLDHTTSAISGRDLLTSIKLCVDSSNCLPATTFTWQNSSAQTLKFEPMSDANGTMLYQGVETLSSVLPRGDHNADGVRDWQGYYVDAEGNAVANTLTFNACRLNIFTRQHECHDGDFDQDGKSDQWRVEANKLVLQLSSSGKQFNTDINMPAKKISALKQYSHIRQIGDFNGDGFPDILVFISDEQPNVDLYYHTKNINSPYESEASHSWQLKTYPEGAPTGLLTELSVVGDISGDGTLDVMLASTGFAEKAAYIQPLPIEFWLGDDDYKKAVESPFEQTDSSPFTPNLSYFIDINGDGLPDWIGGNSEGATHSLSYRLNQGGGVNFSAEDTFEGNAGIENRLESFSNGSDGTDVRNIPKYYAAFKIEDIDYDGIPELLMPGTRVYESCHKVINAGRADRRCGANIYSNYFPGEGGEGAAQSPINAQRNDKSIYQFDALKFSKNQNGTYAITKVPTDFIGSAYDSAFVDVYGTGLRSLVFNHHLGGTHSMGEEQVNTQFSQHAQVQGIYINRNYGAGGGTSGADYAPIDMLQQVENGVGVVSKWTQRPLSSSSTDYEIGATNTDNQQGYFNFASSMYVVTQFEQSNGVGSTRTKQYGYYGAMYNAQGRGFMGFKSVIEKDVALGVVTRSDFDQIFPYQGKLIRQAQFKAADYTLRSNELLASATTETTAISHTDNTWEKTGRYVYLSEQTTIQRDIDSSYTNMFTNALTVDTIDECGNVTKSTQTRSDAWGKYITTTEATVDDTASCSNTINETWWPHKLESKTVTKSKITERNSDDPVMDSANTVLDSKVSIVTEFSEYQANRKPKTVTVSGKVGDTGSGKGKTTTTIYNIYGLPTSVSETAQVRNSAGSWVDSTRTTSMTYSKNGTSEASDGYFPLTVTNAKDHQVTTHTDVATGQPTKQLRQVSATGWVSTSYGYDKFHRPFSQKTDGMPIQYTAIQSVTGDEHKPAHAVMVVKQSSAGAPEVRVYKDKLGRTIRTASQAFDGTWVYQDVSFDHLGRTSFESMPYKSGGNRIGTSYSGFDELNRPTTKTVAQECGQSSTGTMTVSYGYSGLQTTIDVSESCNSITLGQMSRTYNSLKQLVHTQDAKNGNTYYGYNSLGLPAVIEDAAGNQIKATYNALGRKTKVDDPNQGSTTFAYNGFGELQQEVRGNGTKVTYLTDALGRVSQRSATGEQTLSYSYDGTNGYGQMTSASGNGVTHTYGFDALGRPSSHTVAGSGKSYTTTTFYDGNYGRVKGVRYPNDLTLEYTYNDLGYQESVKNAAYDYVYQSVTTQDILGNITQSTLGNGLTQKQFYSLASGQMTGSYTETEHGGQLMSLNYTQYDGFGNLKAMTVTTGSFDNQHSFSESYEYDNLHRLTSNQIDGIPTISYAYDAVGNLTKKSDYASEYNYGTLQDGLPNAVKKVHKTDGTWVDFSYDARGNMTQGDGLTSAIYNAMDKPTSLTKNGITSTFVYGPDHMRFKQVKGNTTTYYAGAYEEEVEGSKTTWRAYIGDIAVVSQGSNESAVIRYTHRDRLGSARLFTDRNGKVIAERNFDPFGKPRQSSGGSKAVSQLEDKDLAKTNRGFTDHEHLDELELIHMNGRVYDYNLGRFMSVDPVIQSPGNSQSINPYSYIMNNPLAGTDPSGYEAKLTGSHVKSAGEASSSNLSIATYDNSEERAINRANFADKSLARGWTNYHNKKSNGAGTSSTPSSKETTDIGGEGEKEKGGNLDSLSKNILSYAEQNPTPIQNSGWEYTGKNDKGMKTYQTVHDVTKDDGLSLGKLNDNFITPAGLTAGYIQNTYGQTKNRWSDRFRNHGKIWDKARLVGNYAFIIGSAITAGTTFMDLINMRQKDSSVEKMALRGLDGIADIAAGTLAFAGPIGWAGAAIYYGADYLSGGNLTEYLYRSILGRREEEHGI
ncbi:hypothetical protein PA25_36100 [Pseudoalteromonas sp. A25]|uniref:tandem-95 repeat protein n=1 Tax=Pseudoalteromonas sp. A25 TaxID=116092 RepID=UPI0012605308|nr:tandem-95 repeat protein [Pseudoalteromonas sp. A25]BBN83625.1 hypothetical protein PA25_36100 [Pseudoalteromonas sp. A25]